MYVDLKEDLEPYGNITVFVNTGDTLRIRVEGVDESMVTIMDMQSTVLSHIDEESTMSPVNIGDGIFDVTYHIPMRGK